MHVKLEMLVWCEADASMASLKACAMYLAARHGTTFCGRWHGISNLCESSHLAAWFRKSRHATCFDPARVLRVLGDVWREKKTKRTLTELARNWVAHRSHASGDFQIIC